MATMSELKATTTARERVEAAVAKAQASQPRLNALKISWRRWIQFRTDRFTACRWS